MDVIMMKPRAYLTGGAAAFTNLFLHATDRQAWSNMGALALGLAAIAIVTLVVAMAYVQRSNKVSLLALLSSAFFLIFAMLIAGERLFRSGWFRQYLN